MFIAARYVAIAASSDGSGCPPGKNLKKNIDVKRKKAKK
jgi:hypothetical protein